jgi:predicted ATPase
MITGIELANIRLFEDANWRLRLRPLTVLCGTNGAGKSTLLKLLLLLRQSQGIDETYARHPGRLRLTGTQVDLGTYADLVSHNDLARDATVALSLTSSMPRRAYMTMLPSGTTRRGGETEDQRDPSPWVPYTLLAQFTFGVGARLDDIDASRSEPNPFLKIAAFKVRAPDAAFEWSVKLSTRESERWPDGSPTRSVAPTAGGTTDMGPSYELVVSSDYVRLLGPLRTVVGAPQLGTPFLRFAVSLDGLLPERVVADRPSAKGRTSAGVGQAWREYALPELIGGPLTHLRYALSRVHYVGPLRSPAKRFYVAYVDAGERIDPSGELLPIILRDRGRELVVNHTMGAQGVKRREPLSTALDYWLYYLRTGVERVTSGGDPEIAAVSTKGVVVELRLRATDGRESHALADSGFGYSQVMPILVRALMAKPDDTTIIEQPELHLNPALQVRLAEFLVAMVRAGKQVLIETHSEHIVDAIRVLAAEDSTKSLAGQVGIAFIDLAEGRPVMRDLSIEPNGMVPDWPIGFFGEAADLTGRLLRAQRRLRAEQRRP